MGNWRKSCHKEITQINWLNGVSIYSKTWSLIYFYYIMLQFLRLLTISFISYDDRVYFVITVVGKN